MLMGVYLRPPTGFILTLSSNVSPSHAPPDFGPLMPLDCTLRKVGRFDIPIQPKIGLIPTKELKALKGTPHLAYSQVLTRCSPREKTHPLIYPIQPIIFMWRTHQRLTWDVYRYNTHQSS